MAEWVRAGRPTSPPSVRPATAPIPGGGLIIDEIILRYLTHCDAYYRDPDGRPTREPEDVRVSLKPLSKLYGPTPAAAFGAKAYKLVRDELIRARLCRRIVNQRAARVKRLFKWATAEELVPAAVFHAVQSVENLKPGRSAAPESEPIRPVDPEHVAAAPPHMTRPVAAMVRVQLLSGCRPGEVVQMRTADIDRSGDVWTYTPHQHKGRWRGRPRTIYLGPQCQAVLTPYLRPDEPDRYLFCPAEAMAELRAAQRAKRTGPGNRKPRVANPRKRPGDRYTARSYTQAVAKACRKAGVPVWCPLQLRHTAATEARRIAGLDAAQALLGHVHVGVTQVYAEKNDDLGKKIVKLRG